MAKFSPITASIQFPVPTYLRDHRLTSQVVLPAVVALRILADTARTYLPHTDIRQMQDIALSRLLPIYPNDTSLSLFIEIRATEDNHITTALLTRFTSKSGSITRMKEHVSVTFTEQPDKSPNDNTYSGNPPAIDPAGFAVSADRLYRELVPFGPGFQSLTGDIHLSPQGATGIAATPTSTKISAGPLGSPFPLDGAFHAACAWGQRYAQTVAYPIAISRRTIFRPTVPGDPYLIQTIPINTTAAGLSFDIRIEALSGKTHEIIRGVRMRPIVGLSNHPPDWIVV